ncbi:MAG: hypothetical protein KGM46_03250 [Pseudomonadota bacterium]|jgi:hypothetical protein|nr:hypothetical protein [Xanthomonadaceae bacterium]MDE2249657.1 hypothetical protein [Xanthomonadaceae bacterium]MDE3209736.1 hypothetical protein [Pseudomonadota bacterium]
MTDPGLFRLRGPCLAIGLLAAIAAAGCHAAEASQDRTQPALIVAYHTTPTHWLAFRKALRSEELPYLQALQQQGVLRGYHLLFNRQLDSSGWNAMAIITFNGAAGLARWTRGASTMPGGLTQDELALTSRIESTPARLVRRGMARKAAASPVTLAIPYRYKVSEDAYVKYLDGYTIPQLQGWIDAGVLARYTIFLAQYPAGRPWSAMLVLDYRSDAALAARDGVKARVRARLAGNPAWKAISDDKKSVRDELAPTLADDAGGR